MRLSAKIAQLLIFVVFPVLVWAGSPHFVSCTPSVDGDQLCVTGKEAGLGNESQVDVTLLITAHCQNHGGNDPSAQNKVTFQTTAQEPVQNGKALYDLCVTATFTPNCTPPMSAVIDAVSLFDDTNDISCVLSFQ